MAKRSRRGRKLGIDTAKNDNLPRPVHLMDDDEYADRVAPHMAFLSSRSTVVARRSTHTHFVQVSSMNAK